jgi:hypothetical protein
MSGQSDWDLSVYEYKTRAEKLCAQGRFIERRWRQLEAEREDLSRQADQLRDAAARVATIIQGTHNGIGDNLAELLGLMNNMSQASDRLKLSDGSAVPDNVRPLFDYIEDYSKQDQAENPMPSPSTAPRSSMRVLCQQARYIVVYLERAIQSNDVACLPRLAEDLTRISSVMYSAKIKAICDQFVRAIATENWSTIKILHKALDEELSAITEGVGSPVTFLQAG